MPADVVLLAVHEPDPTHPDGVCYLETKSLDGETNLKLRCVYYFLLYYILNNIHIYQPIQTNTHKPQGVGGVHGGANQGRRGRELAAGAGGDGGQA